jgi:hypothetical protein
MNKVGSLIFRINVHNAAPACSLKGRFKVLANLLILRYVHMSACVRIFSKRLHMLTHDNEQNIFI